MKAKKIIQSIYFIIFKDFQKYNQLLWGVQMTAGIAITHGGKTMNTLIILQSKYSTKYKEITIA